MSVPVAKAKGKYKIKRRGRKPRSYAPLSPYELKLVESHLDIILYPVYSTMISSSIGSFTREDIRQIAYFALCVAAKDFDKSRNILFKTYAQNKITFYISHAIRDLSRTITPTRTVMEIWSKVKHLRELGKSIEEIAILLGVSEEDVRLSCIPNGCLSLDYETDNSYPVEPVYINCSHPPNIHLNENEINNIRNFLTTGSTWKSTNSGITA